MASPSETMAYLAGLFDGEGCITYKQYWDRTSKGKPQNIFVGEYELR